MNLPLNLFKKLLAKAEDANLSVPTPKSECRSDDPEHCRVHGTAYVKKEIVALLKQNGIRGNVSVAESFGDLMQCNFSSMLSSTNKRAGGIIESWLKSRGVEDANVQVSSNGVAAFFTLPEPDADGEADKGDETETETENADKGKGEEEVDDADKDAKPQEADAKADKPDETQKPDDAQNGNALPDEAMQSQAEEDMAKYNELLETWKSATKEEIRTGRNYADDIGKKIEEVERVREADGGKNKELDRLLSLLKIRKAALENLVRDLEHRAPPDGIEALNADILQVRMKAANDIYNQLYAANNAYDGLKKSGHLEPTGKNPEVGDIRNDVNGKYKGKRGKWINDLTDQFALKSYFKSRYRLAAGAMSKHEYDADAFEKFVRDAVTAAIDNVPTETIEAMKESDFGWDSMPYETSPVGNYAHGIVANALEHLIADPKFGNKHADDYFLEESQNSKEHFELECETYVLLDRIKMGAYVKSCTGLTGKKGKQFLKDCTYFALKQMPDGVFDEMGHIPMWIARTDFKRALEDAVRFHPLARAHYIENAKAKKEANAAKLAREVERKAAMADKSPEGIERYRSQCIARLKDRLPAKLSEGARQTFDNAPAEIVALVDAANPTFKMNSGKKSDCSANNLIRISKGDWGNNRYTVAHEAGHAVLNHLGVTWNKPAPPHLQEIVSVALEEATALADKMMGADWQKQYRNRGNEYPAYKKLYLDLYHGDPNRYWNSSDVKKAAGMLSDIMCAATNGEYFSGHSRKYFRGCAANPLHEIVADVTSVICTDDRTAMEVMPRTIQMVKERVYGFKSAGVPSDGNGAAQ